MQGIESRASVLIRVLFALEDSFTGRCRNCAAAQWKSVRTKVHDATHRCMARQEDQITGPVRVWKILTTRVRPAAA